MNDLLCPLMAYHIGDCLGGKVKCLGKQCALAADEAGNCLIKQFLETQVSQSVREKEMAKTYWATKKDGTRQLIAFPPSPTKDVLVVSCVPDNETPEFKPPRHC